MLTYWYSTLFSDCMWLKQFHLDFFSTSNKWTVDSSFFAVILVILNVLDVSFDTTAEHIITTLMSGYFNDQAYHSIGAVIVQRRSAEGTYMDIPATWLADNVSSGTGGHWKGARQEVADGTFHKAVNFLNKWLTRIGFTHFHEYAVFLQSRLVD